MERKLLSQGERWIINGIPVIIAIGSVMHFAYDFTKGNLLVGLIAPVNESVWEHMKMALLPVILWWSAYYLIKGSRTGIEANKWFAGVIAAMLTSLLAIPLLYYFYTGAFGLEILVVDIFIFIIAILLGQLLGLHYYRYSKGISSYIAAAVIIFLILVFACFTIDPPHLPIFRDNATGGYGIIKSFSPEIFNLM